MTNRTQFHIALALMSLVIVGLATTNWILRPDSASSWVAAMTALPIFYLVETFFHKGNRKRAHRPDESRFFHGSILVAGLMLVAGLGLKMVDFLSDFSLDTTERVFGVAMGLVLVVMGNMLPKKLGPLGDKTVTLYNTPAIQRFAGRSFVLAGLGYAGAWIILPVDQANSVAMGICLTAVILVLLRLTWALTFGRRT